MAGKREHEVCVCVCVCVSSPWYGQRKAECSEDRSSIDTVGVFPGGLGSGWVGSGESA